VVPALFLAVITAGLFRATAPKAVVGAPAPEFRLRSLDGTTITSGDLKGSPVVVNFWASWCVSCREEAADLERMWKAYGPRGIRFIGVTYDDGIEEAKAFVEQHPTTYPSLHDPDRRLATGFGVRGVPETFFIDQDWTFAGFEAAGQIASQNGTVVRGPIPAPVLEAHLESLLAGRERSAQQAPPAP
jgi:cytochrome c biogenesis protein CcmG/thiol:disulfide interchange protein DsbE